MWLNQYKKTFVGMQLVIALITAAVFFGMYRAWAPTVLLLPRVAGRRDRGCALG